MLNVDAQLKELKQAIQKEVIVTAYGRNIISVDELTRAPWIFDFRALLLQSKWLKKYAELFWEQYEAKYPFQVCGMESAAISLVAAIAMEGEARGKPVNGLFIRKSRKRTGLMKQIEGKPNLDPVILVDDLIHSGNSFEKQIKVLEREGLEVSDLFALVAFYETGAYEHLLGNHRKLHHLFTLQDFDVSLPHQNRMQQLEEVWRFAAREPAHNIVVQKSTPALDGERCYFGTDAGTFFALNQRDGSVAWSFDTGKHPDGKGIFSSPVVYKGSVYFGAYDGNVYALEAKTGKKLWDYSEADWIGSSPALACELGLLFIGLEFGLLMKRGGVAAIKMDTGKCVWKNRTAQLTHGSPLYIPERHMVVIGSNDNIVYAYEAETGLPLWRYNATGSVKASFSYDAKRELIFFGTLGGSFYALTFEGVPVFAHELFGGMYSTPLVYDNKVFFSSLDKNIYAVEPSTGKTLWSFGTAGRVFASPVVVDRSLFVGSNDGCLYEINYKTGKGGPVFQATERIVNAIAFNESTKDFFVPTQANELYCLRRSG